MPKNRIEIVKQIEYYGPYQPVVLFPRTNIGGKNRSFHENYYTQFKWIEYSPLKDGAFCFPCRLFKGNSINGEQIDLAFTSKGFKNWKDSVRSFTRHQSSKVYLFSSTSWHSFLNKKPIDVIINENKALVLVEREKERLNNR